MGFYKKIRFWLFLIASLAVLFFILKKAFSSIEVKTEAARRQALEITVTATATGTIKSNIEVSVSAERPGRISRLVIEEGDTVMAGSLLAELDPKEAYLSLEMAKASYERAKAMLDAMRTAFEPFSVDVESAIQKAEANLYEAQKRLKRAEGLKDKGLISEAEWDSIKRDYDVLKSAYESSLSGRKGLASKAEEIKAQEAALAEAGNALSLAKLNYDYSFIKSPISGVVSSRPVRLSETVMKGSLLATLIATDSLYIEAFIDEADVERVRINQDVRISMDAYPGRTFQGRVYMISPVVLGGKQETRAFEVRTRLKDKGIAVKHGMSADIEIVVDRVASALIVPSQAVIEKNNSRYVFLKDRGRARLKKIDTGLYNWTYTEIISGIKEGDAVIVNPDVPGLKDGVRVRDGGADN